MKDTWHNNRIGKKLNEEFSKDFAICDVDGLVKCFYTDNKGQIHTRLIIYESKNENEKKMGAAQRNTLQTLANSIDWSKFDSLSGLFVLKIVDIDNRIIWYDINGEKIRETTFAELYNIFSCKDIDNQSK
jgi:hypothetical protein